MLQVRVKKTGSQMQVHSVEAKTVAELKEELGITGNLNVAINGIPSNDDSSIPGATVNGDDVTLPLITFSEQVKGAAKQELLFLGNKNGKNIVTGDFAALALLSDTEIKGLNRKSKRAMPKLIKKMLRA